MKTQLLEDIGQSATLSLIPSKIEARRKINGAVEDVAPARTVEPVMSRAGFGVWRHKPVAEPVVPMVQQPEPPPTPLELQDVFEEIAALEAQYVSPDAHDLPGIAENSIEQKHSTPPVEANHRQAQPPTESTLFSSQTPITPGSWDPLFDFTPTAPAVPTPDPFTTAPSGLSASKRRYVMWGACVLAIAMLIQGGRLLYQDRGALGSPALIADAGQVKPQVDKAVKRRAHAATESTLRPEGEVLVATAAPPLVLLDPEPPKAVNLAQSSPRTVSPVAAQTPRKQSGVTAEPATAKREREPVRQYARASAARTEEPIGRSTSMAETLKACREHGYSEAQCIRRACSVTKYGFVCRGR